MFYTILGGLISIALIFSLFLCTGSLQGKKCFDLYTKGSLIFGATMFIGVFTGFVCDVYPLLSKVTISIAQ